MDQDALLDRIASALPHAERFSPEAARGAAVIVVAPGRICETLRILRDHPELHFDMLSDLTAVDYLGREPRFEVIYQLYSVPLNHRLRVKVPVAEEHPSLPSAVPVWKSAAWAEREVWDMFGIRFEGHPDLRRILMYPEFVGHPLRKDYPLDRRQPLVPERDPIAHPWFPHRA
jgi:NADH-quinone oxidoreductase subunit C